MYSALAGGPRPSPSQVFRPGRLGHRAGLLRHDVDRGWPAYSSGSWDDRWTCSRARGPGGSRASRAWASWVPTTGGRVGGGAWLRWGSARPTPTGRRRQSDLHRRSVVRGNADIMAYRVYFSSQSAGHRLAASGSIGPTLRRRTGATMRHWSDAGDGELGTMTINPAWTNADLFLDDVASRMGQGDAGAGRSSASSAIEGRFYLTKGRASPVGPAWRDLPRSTASVGLVASRQHRRLGWPRSPSRFQDWLGGANNGYATAGDYQGDLTPTAPKPGLVSWRTTPRWGLLPEPRSSPTIADVASIANIDEATAYGLAEQLDHSAWRRHSAASLLPAIVVLGRAPQKATAEGRRCQSRRPFPAACGPKRTCVRRAPPIDGRRLYQPAPS